LKQPDSSLKNIIRDIAKDFDEALEDRNNEGELWSKDELRGDSG